MAEIDDDTLLSACPECRTRFRVTEALLEVADGRVRCGACLQVFDGRAQLLPREVPREETVPDASDGRTNRVSIADQAAQETVAQQEHAGDNAKPRPVADQAARETVTPEPTAVARRSDQVKPPVAASTQTPTSAPPVPGSLRPAWAAATIAAVLLLVVNVSALFYEPWSRGIYEATCVVIGCEPLRSLDKIKVRNQPDDRPGPPHQLSLALELTNEAVFAQPFPTVLVRLTDANGQRVAEHGASPADYLGANVDLMQPNQASQVVLRVEDPGRDAVAYSLVLL